MRKTIAAFVVVLVVITEVPTHTSPTQGKPQYQASQPQPQPPQQPDARSRGTVCVALYDYSGTGADEVSFAEGDNIIECNPIDGDWMQGVVKRTGEYGMFPSNYVEQV